MYHSFIKRLFAVTSLCALLCSCSSPTFGGGVEGDNRVVVAFENPGHYRDVRLSSQGPTDMKTLDHLRSFILAEAGQYLGPEYRMAMTFEDIDLAGAFQSAGAGSMSNMRMLHRNFPPWMIFRFVVSSTDGAIVHEEKVRLTEPGFLEAYFRLGAKEDLYYDKQMLSRWMKRTLPGIRLPVSRSDVTAENGSSGPLDRLIRDQSATSPTPTWLAA